MYETWHLATAYVAGTAAGIGIFRWWIKERIITATIDSLVDQEYVRSYEDENGITHLYKWHEFDDILEKIRAVQEEEYEKDDTP
jgi:spermidine/putrescine-binding protein